MKFLRAHASVLLLLGLAGCHLFEVEPTQPAPETSQPPLASPPQRHPSAVGYPARGTPQSPEAAAPMRADNARKARDKYRHMSFEEFKAAVWQEPDFLGGKFIVNGDQAIADVKHLDEFFETRIKQEPEPRTPGDIFELTLATTVGGQEEVWNQTLQRQLTYCVSEAFGDRYLEVVDSMAAAAEAWEAAADIDFIHNPGADGSCTASNPDIVFDVRPVNVNGNYLARAFFPNEPRSARNVLIDESAFHLSGPNLTLIGILRHELGHALGFRHEHTRPDAGACFEDSDWLPVTDYDPFSVMHYPQCNGLGDWSLTLTHLDQNGAACIYGPAPGFTIDPGLTLQNCREAVTAPCAPRTQVFEGSVTRSEEKHFGPFSVLPGSSFEALMSGTGDPDLYVRFGQKPTPTAYQCRPYLSGATEECHLDVPDTAHEAFVMVRGYTAGTFTLAVTFTGVSP